MHSLRDLRGEVWLKADFGAIGDGLTDDTAAVHAFLAESKVATRRVESGSYLVKAAPPKLDYPIRLEGVGIDESEFIRDYDEGPGRGFLHFEGVKSARGPTLAHFSINSAPNRRGGHALVAKSTEDHSFGNMRVEHVKFSTYGVDNWDATVLIDGTAKTREARGVRAVHFDGCLIFGAAGYSLILRGVVDFRYDGGIYAAGGKSPYSGGVLVTGTTTVPSSGVMLIGNAFGYLNLSHITGMKVIATSGIAGQQIGGEQVAIDNDKTVDRVQIIGEPYGKVARNWTNSSIMLPDGSIVK
jgi:hypothetical protein